MLPNRVLEGILAIAMIPAVIACISSQQRGSTCGPHSQGVLEGLEHRNNLEDSEPPAGALKARLYDYQKKALTWMRKREEANNVRGGILADEQGLGKTVQMLALIVSVPPSKENAEYALKNCTREETNMQFHALGRSARDQRAALEAGMKFLEGLVAPAVKTVAFADCLRK